ncbi:hypothetical protein C3L50_03360 [Flavobacterium alvei]|uniref:HNH endonuclease n=1 Tax=Flavobacterium alvei TaxID=2080416 RepID=A0A2S5ADQ3_9FLAO|nr:hypothetical protein [Flavobacterium alvei]POY40552.1 hypothetical protein C3L50_03360 [Flavobacterium alvei]
MLRVYQPITSHPIYTLHSQLEHLVCEVWCNANATPCENLLQPSFRIIYNAYSWLKTDIDTIYAKCVPLTVPERELIRTAFNVNNRIEELCNGTITPVYLNALPDVVKNDMKPLLVKFYNNLLDLAQVAGNKLQYYNQLVTTSKFSTCPCCGLSPIESAETHYREDNDHYLPKADFPFASVNFKNLVPLCGKCNKKCKGSKNPIEAGRRAFFPYNLTPYAIEVRMQLVNNSDINFEALRNQDIAINFIGDAPKISTWDWVFEIEERYNEEVRKFSKTELRILANRKRIRNREVTYSDIIDEEIINFEIDKYEDRKFLKISFYEAIKNRPDWMAVYE